MRTIYKNSLDAMEHTPKVPKAQLHKLQTITGTVPVSTLIDSNNINKQMNIINEKVMIEKEDFEDQKPNLLLLQQQMLEQQLSATSHLLNGSSSLSSIICDHHLSSCSNQVITNSSSSNAADLGLMDGSSTKNVGGCGGNVYDDPQTIGLVELNSFTCPLDGCEFWSTNEQELKSHFVECHVKPPAHNPAAEAAAAGGRVQNYVFKCIRENCDELLVDVDAFLKHLQMHDKIMANLINQQQQQSIGPIGSSSTGVQQQPLLPIQKQPPPTTQTQVEIKKTESKSPRAR